MNVSEITLISFGRVITRADQKLFYMGLKDYFLFQASGSWDFVFVLEAEGYPCDPHAVKPDCANFRIQVKRRFRNYVFQKLSTIRENFIKKTGFLSRILSLPPVYTIDLGAPCI